MLLTTRPLPIQEQRSALEQILSLLAGGGSLVSGGLDLNNANSKLLLNSITVDSVSTTIDNSLGVDVDNNSTITSLSVANITPVSIASGKSLSGAITVTAGSLKLR